MQTDVGQPERFLLGQPPESPLGLELRRGQGQVVAAFLCQWPDRVFRPSRSAGGRHLEVKVRRGQCGQTGNRRQVRQKAVASLVEPGPLHFHFLDADARVGQLDLGHEARGGALPGQLDEPLSYPRLQVEDLARPPEIRQRVPVAAQPDCQFPLGLLQLQRRGP